MAAAIIENSAHYSPIRNDRREFCENRDGLSREQFNRVKAAFADRTDVIVARSASAYTYYRIELSQRVEEVVRVRDAKTGAARAALVTQADGTWIAVLDGVEIVRGSLEEIAARAKAPRPPMTGPARDALFERLDARGVGKLVIYTDERQAKAVVGESYRDNGVAAFACLEQGYIARVGEEQRTGTLDDVIAFVAPALVRPPREVTNDGAESGDTEDRSIELPEWTDLRGAVSEGRDGDRLVRIVERGDIDMIVRIEDGREDPSPAQLAAIEGLVANAAHLRQVALDVLFACCQKMLWRLSDEDELRRMQPHDLDELLACFARHAKEIGIRKLERSDVEGSTAGALKNATRAEAVLPFVRLSQVTVLAASTDGLAYLSASFEVAWSIHGVGVLFHGLEPIASGSSYELESSSVAAAYAAGYPVV
jgi:hypothetical protein